MQRLQVSTSQAAGKQRCQIWAPSFGSMGSRVEGTARAVCTYVCTAQAAPTVSFIRLPKDPTVASPESRRGLWIQYFST